MGEPGTERNGVWTPIETSICAWCHQERPFHQLVESNAEFVPEGAPTGWAGKHYCCWECLDADDDDWAV